MVDPDLAGTARLGDGYAVELPGLAQLAIREEQATRLEEEVFPEFKNLTPAASNQTMRSHMTAGWYTTLQAVQGKVNFPVCLFPGLAEREFPF